MTSAPSGHADGQQALQRSEDPTHHLGGRDALDDRVGVDVDHRVGEPDEEHRHERRGERRNGGDQQQRRSPQDHADAEVAGQPPTAGEHEHDEAAEDASDAEHRVEQPET